MNQEITLPFCSTLKMVATHDKLVYFYTNCDNDIPFAYWDIEHNRLSVYGESSYVVFEDVKTLLEADRIMGAI